MKLPSAKITAWFLGACLVAMVIVFADRALFSRPATPPVQTVHAFRGTAEDWDRLTGHVTYLQAERLTFDHPGAAEKIYVKTGDVVAAGQLLAEQPVSTEERRSSSAEEAAVEMARRTRDRTEDTAKLARDLYEVGAESRQSWSEKQRAAQDAKVELHVREAALAGSHTAGRSLQMRAPRIGRIAEINLRNTEEPGSTAGVLLTSTATDGIVATVDDATASRLRPGQSVMYEAGIGTAVSLLKGEGVVRNISELPAPGPMAGSTRAGLQIQIAVAREDVGKLHVNEPVRLRILLARHENALLVPAEAVVSHNGQHYVLPVRAGVVHWRLVKTGIEQEQTTEILDRILEPDEPLIVPVDGAPREGQLVTVMPPS